MPASIPSSTILPTVALRYFNVYGPRQSADDCSGVVSVFLDQARRGEPLTVHGDGTQTRDFVHVDDVVRANLLAATTDATGETYNVGAGSSVSIAELAETVQKLTGTDSPITNTAPRPDEIPQALPISERHVPNWATSRPSRSKTDSERSCEGQSRRTCDTVCYNDLPAQPQDDRCFPGNDLQQPV